MVSRVESRSVYTDLSGLNEITRLGRENSPEAMRQVAQQFESVFLGVMLKAMRDANALFSEGNYLQSNEMDFHQENFDNQLSLHMSEGQGLGLADVLFEQMMGQYGLQSPDAVPPRRDWPLEQPRPVREAMPLAARVRTATPATATTTTQTAATHAQATPVSALGVAARSATTAPASGQKSVSDPIKSPQDFVHSLYPIAQKVAHELGVDPRVLLAQSALETGWGRQLASRADGRSTHNLFGIKADARWDGERATVSTLEYRDGVARLEKASFRAYGSYEESFRDYVKFLQENPRYSAALDVAHSPEAFARRLQEAGYATDPVYASKITGVMNSPIMQSSLARLQGTVR